MFVLILSLILCINVVNNSLIYSTYYGSEITQDQYDNYVASGNSQYCAVVFEECNPTEGRRVDGTCNNLKYPSLGSTLTPFDRLLPANFFNGTSLRKSLSGNELPNARLVRTTLLTEGEVLSSKWSSLNSHMLTHLAADVTTQHDTVYISQVTTCCQPEGATDARCMPISVPEDDPYLAGTGVTCLNLTRAISYQSLGCVSASEPLKRITYATPMIDLSIVYGLNDKALEEKGRLFEGGLLKVNATYGRIFPPNNATLNPTRCPLNVLPEESMCFDTPNNRFNGLVSQTLASVWFWRTHNEIARILAGINPHWDDETLFTSSRNINIAISQHILTYELMPNVIGKSFGIKYGAFSDLSKNPGFVDNYDDTIEPRTYIEFVAGLRWFHQIVGDKISRYDHKGNYLGYVDNIDYTLRPGVWPINNTIEEFTQESFRYISGEADTIIGRDIGERALSRLQKVSDVTASDLMKSRDQGLPPYNDYREFCGLTRANNFSDLLDVIPADKVELLQSLYEDVNDIDFQAGIWVESIMEDAMVGPTLGCIMAKQFKRYRTEDRFWYEHPNVPGGLNEEQLAEIRKASLALIICYFGDQVDEIQPHPLRTISAGNPLTSCSDESVIPRINFTLWKSDATSNNYGNQLKNRLRRYLHTKNKPKKEKPKFSVKQKQY